MFTLVVLSATIRLILGLISTFFGYRLLRLYIFLTGVFFGMLFGNLLLLRLSFGDLTVNLILSTLAGVAVGSVTLWLQPLGIFAIGALAGGMTGYLTALSIGYEIYDVVVPIIFICVIGLIFGIFAVVIKRPFVTFALCWTGSVSTFIASGQFAGSYPYPHRLEEHGPSIIPSGWWFSLLGIAVLCGLGMLVQFLDFERIQRLNQRNPVDEPVDEKVICHV